MCGNFFRFFLCASSQRICDLGSVRTGQCEFVAQFARQSGPGVTPAWIGPGFGPPGRTFPHRRLRPWAVACCRWKPKFLKLKKQFFYKTLVVLPQVFFNSSKHSGSNCFTSCSSCERQRNTTSFSSSWKRPWEIGFCHFLKFFFKSLGLYLVKII